MLAWESAVALKEVGDAMTQYHIVNNWLWLGAVDDINDAATLLRTPAGFDHDGYKILCKPVWPVSLRSLSSMARQPRDFAEQ